MDTISTSHIVITQAITAEMISFL